MNIKIIGVLVITLGQMTLLPTEEEQNCLICYEELFDNQNDVIILACSGTDQKHAFHFTCINLWQQQKNQCPYCRVSLCDTSKNRMYNYNVIPQESHSFKNDLKSFFNALCCFSNNTID